MEKNLLKWMDWDDCDSSVESVATRAVAEVVRLRTYGRDGGCARTAARARERLRHEIGETWFTEPRAGREGGLPCLVRPAGPFNVRAAASD